jgi:hypothetical protein
MDEHTRIERDLKRDIHLKNLLRKDLLGHMGQVHTWHDRLRSLKNVRRERRLKGSIARYATYIDELRSYLVPMLDDVEDRIRTEMSFSEEEIEGFRADLEKEKLAVVEARKAFDLARAALEQAEGRPGEGKEEDMAALKQTFSGAYRALRLEKHRLEDASEELESEFRDKDFFAQELKRIYLEKQLFADSSSSED